MSLLFKYPYFPVRKHVIKTIIRYFCSLSAISSFQQNLHLSRILSGSKFPETACTLRVFLWSDGELKLWIRWLLKEKHEFMFLKLYSKAFHSGRKGFFEGSKYCSVCLYSTALIVHSYCYIFFLVALCMDASMCFVAFAPYVMNMFMNVVMNVMGCWNNFPLSPQWDVRTWKFVSAPQETPSSWSFWDPTLTPSLRATSWAMAAACSPNSSFGCLRTNSHMKQSLVRKSNDVQYFQLMHKEKSDLKGLMTSSLLFLFV